MLATAVATCWWHSMNKKWQPKSIYLKKWLQDLNYSSLHKNIVSPSWKIDKHIGQYGTYINIFINTEISVNKAEALLNPNKYSNNLFSVSRQMLL